MVFPPPEHLHILSSNTIENIANKYDLILIKKGHFEITKFRYLIRYYIFGLIETIIGLPFYFMSKNFFDKFKMQRISSYKGIQYLILKKTNNLNILILHILLHESNDFHTKI